MYKDRYYYSKVGHNSRNVKSGRRSAPLVTDIAISTYVSEGRTGDTRFFIISACDAFFFSSGGPTITGIKQKYGSRKEKAQAYRME